MCNQKLIESKNICSVPLGFYGLYDGTALQTHTVCHRQLKTRHFNTTTRLLTKSSQVSSAGEVEVRYDSGLPVFFVPLPSRHELCQFTLRPVSNTVGDFLQCLHDEDHGIDRVVIYNQDGTRIARSTPIDILLRNNFELVINDNSYQVCPPPLVNEPSEHLTQISDMKNTIAHLYNTLNVDQHMLNKEKEALARVENIQVQIKPYQDVLAEMNVKAAKHSKYVAWAWLGTMGTTFGILARLTWWEYSWDIMEPVTYFVGFSYAIMAAGYYLLTHQDFTYKDAKEREFHMKLHKLAKKNNFNLDHYNRLCAELHKAENDLRRLRDPLQLNLPMDQLKPVPKTFNTD